MDNSKRIFTDKELEEMGKRPLDLLLEAIDAGDKEKAKRSYIFLLRQFSCRLKNILQRNAVFTCRLFAILIFG
jgi:hypothetical protein